VSNEITYDSLLVRHLVRELNDRLKDHPCAAAPVYASDRSVTLPLHGNEALQIDLHPSRGWIRLVAWDAVAGDEPAALCTGVYAPDDERLFRISIRGGSRFRTIGRDLVVELHTNQWNALLLDREDGRILSVLRPRHAGKRVLQPDEIYRPPPRQHRLGPVEHSREDLRRAWTATLALLPPEQRAEQLIRRFAYCGRINVTALLQAGMDGSDAAQLEESFEKWWAIATAEQGEPVVLTLPAGPHPYPFPLAGVPFTPSSSLLRAMEVAATADQPLLSSSPPDIRVEAVQAKLRAAERKVARIAEQRAAAGEAERLRRRGDLLLAHLHRVTRGAASVTLDGWDGEPVEISLDPALSPAENATKLYSEARQRARAEERLPGLLRAAEEEATRWRDALAAAETGALPEWAAREIERDGSQKGEPQFDAGPTVVLPYRLYRTSGGLEVRVGRSSKHNDRLTFHHSAPDDIWLHARSVAGSHVILRWPDANAAPPARDLAEAAGLAALFSKARSSGIVAVDWTRRKHVRKPRGAPPGAVLPQRVKTLFVEPDPAGEDRMRAAHRDEDSG
jgi:predicted ribosome quality control (RQC) complex YloA/Tae2 family protein